MKRYRILVLAEAANPDWTSVPLIGWNLSEALSEHHDIHVVTQVRNREAILNQGWKEGEQFTAINSERVAAPFFKLASFIRRGQKLAYTIQTATESLSYPYFEYLTWKTFKKDLIEGRYDIVHRVTPVSPTAPSYIAKKLKAIGVPFVVGPLNGGVAWPKQFKYLVKQEKEWLNAVRSAYKMLPGYKSMRTDSTALIGGSKATLEQLPSFTEDKQFYIPENAVKPERFPPPSERPKKDTLKAVFIGRLVPYKGADMAIDAIAGAKNREKIRYEIIGDGPQHDALKNQVETLGLQNEVDLCGFVPNDELHRHLSDADILLFPSVREFGGGVVLEAMATGTVPLIVDYAGPSELVDETNGYKVPLAERDELVKSFSEKLDWLCDNRQDLESKRQAAMDKVREEFTWGAKVKQITEVYDWCAEKKA